MAFLNVWLITGFHATHAQLLKLFKGSGGILHGPVGVVPGWARSRECNQVVYKALFIRRHAVRPCHSFHSIFLSPSTSSPCLPTSPALQSRALSRTRPVPYLVLDYSLFCTPELPRAFTRCTARNYPSCQQSTTLKVFYKLGTAGT